MFYHVLSKNQLILFTIEPDDGNFCSPETPTNLMVKNHGFRLSITLSTYTGFFKKKQPSHEAPQKKKIVVMSPHPSLKNVVGPEFCVWRPSKKQPSRSILHGYKLILTSLWVLMGISTFTSKKKRSRVSIKIGNAISNHNIEVGGCGGKHGISFLSPVDCRDFLKNPFFSMWGPREIENAKKLGFT